MRDTGDVTAVHARLERSLLKPTDHVIYLRADICRAELVVEIEATLVS